MALLHNFTQIFLRNNSQKGSGIAPSVINQQIIVVKPSAKPKTLAELEQEIAAQVQVKCAG